MAFYIQDCLGGAKAEFFHQEENWSIFGDIFYTPIPGVIFRSLGLQISSLKRLQWSLHSPRYIGSWCFQGIKSMNMMAASSPVGFVVSKRITQTFLAQRMGYTVFSGTSLDCV